MGEFPIKIRIQHNKAKALLSTGIKVTPEQWDNQNAVVVNHEKSKTFNAVLGSSMQNAQDIVNDLKIMGKLGRLTAQQIKETIESGGVIAQDRNRRKFKVFYQECLESKKKPTTRSSYQQALNNLEKFDPLLEQRFFEDIDYKYLQDLDEWFESREVSVNARAVYYRNLKSVFNDAIDEGLTSEYPFRRFKIKTTPTQKRNISVEELRLLRDFKIDDYYQAKYRDIFMLCFYLRGINAADLFTLKHKDIRLGRLNYIRAKTGKYYSVKIEPEAKAIMDKYKGKTFILDICDGAKTPEEINAKYTGFLKRMGRGLKKIGPYRIVGRGGKRKLKPILPMISQYWCRHTAATLMANIDIPYETISASLGHDHGRKVTNIYIEYNEKKVDEANRMLIDYVNAK